MINPPVYIVDDDACIRESLVFLLDSYDITCTSFASGHDFLNHVDTAKAGCVVLDCRMPLFTGQQLQQLLVEQSSPLAIIFLTGHGDVPMAVDAFKSGAVDFFQKPVDGDALFQAIEKSRVWSQQQYRKHANIRLVTKLTKREQEIFSLIAQGYKNQKISQTLFISVRTVEVHRSNLMKHLNVTTIAELMLIFADTH